ncbi:MAG TPA: hypothetical protein VF397_00445 [Pyrinomonadaceae bacterium]
MRLFRHGKNIPAQSRRRISFLSIFFATETAFSIELNVSDAYWIMVWNCDSMMSGFFGFEDHMASDLMNASVAKVTAKYADEVGSI